MFKVYRFYSADLLRIYAGFFCLFYISIFIINIQTYLLLIYLIIRRLFIPQCHIKAILDDITVICRDFSLQLAVLKLFCFSMSTWAGIRTVSRVSRVSRVSSSSVSGSDARKLHIPTFYYNHLIKRKKKSKRKKLMENVKTSNPDRSIAIRPFYGRSFNYPDKLKFSTSSQEAVQGIVKGLHPKLERLS